ncbi:efflux RND transporter periplasmic adaptor subunit [Nevskia ramosa]|uniref:efflux RND transporter periplasmic adaptor subunit n=1 Tax=Nevskia ramosa TaxID=64002 RepID=UPI002354B89C|nr:efflux RND transporter periplasmic adaptor subunit [Nevskia ramosa]
MTVTKRQSGVLRTLKSVPVSVGLIAALLLSACSKPPVVAEEVRSVRTIVAAPGAVDARNTYAGEVRPRYESNLGFRVTGKIDQRKVNVGDRVRKGQLLLQLDPADLALNEASSQATVTAQEAQFAVEKADLGRYRKLLDTGFISAAEFDRQQTRFAAAEAQLASVRAQARVSGNQTGYAQLHADADGVITAIDAEVGQVVAAGQTIVRLAQAGTMEVAANVPEQLLRTLKPDAPVTVMLWTDDGHEFPGRIRELASSADPATRTYALRVMVDKPPPEMQLGMTASIRIQGPKLPSLIHVPLTAYTEQKSVHGVWVFDEASSEVHFRPVRLSGFDGNSALIAEGLTPGERVVTAGAPLLREGQKVRLMPDAVTPTVQDTAG